MELESLDDMDFDVSLTGFEMPEIEVEDPEIIEDDIPEEVETRCKQGDIWNLGGGTSAYMWRFNRCINY